MATAQQEQSKTAQQLVKADPRALTFKHLFESDNFQRSLKQTLPRHLDPQKIIRVTLAAFQTTPKLLECTPESVVLSLLRAASMGLEPDGGPLGQGYLVPFWSSKNRRNECQFIPGYRGLVKLARNSGEVADVWAEVVYQADTFDYELGINPTLKHKRNDDVADAGPLRFTYAVARFRDGERKFVVMNRREIEGIKAKSQSRNRAGELVGPWVDNEPEMWKKTAVRRLCKLLPLSVDDQRNISVEDDDAAGPTIDFSVPEMPAIEDQSQDDPAPDSSDAPEDHTAEIAREERLSQAQERFAAMTTEKNCDELFAELYAEAQDDLERDTLKQMRTARKKEINPRGSASNQKELAET